MQEYFNNYTGTVLQLFCDSYVCNVSQSKWVVMKYANSIILYVLEI